MVNFNEFVNKDGNYVIEYWFTNGISLDDLNQVVNKVRKSIRTSELSKSLSDSLRYQSHWVSTKKSTNKYSFVIVDFNPRLI